MNLKEAGVLSCLEPEGSIAKSLKGYEPRDEQLSMTSDVLTAYNEGGIALIEAGTGTGKSLAYLLPALLFASEYQERTVISTHTITLQEQLLHKDLPFLLKALKLDLKLALVKGMNNYLCLRKLEDALHEKSLLSEQEAAEIQLIADWAQETDEGSKTTLPIMPAGSTWDKVGAEGDACSHVQCPHYKSCFFFKARKEAQDAQILVANHHLLAADLSSRFNSPVGSEGGILPPYKRLIIDEAHHLEDVATEHFASRVSYWDLVILLGKLGSGQGSGKIHQLKLKLLEQFPDGSVANLLNRVEIDLVADRVQLLEVMRGAMSAVIAFISQSRSEAQDELKLRMIPSFYNATFWQEDVKPNLEKVIETMQHLVSTLSGIEGELLGLKNESLNEKTKSLRLDLQAIVARLEKSADILTQFLAQTDSKETVRWLEVRAMKTLTNVTFSIAQLDISPYLSQTIFSPLSTVVMCSATLSTHRHFDYIRKRLGIDLGPAKRVIEQVYDSPFDYQNQALLAVPTDMPSPTDKRFDQAAISQIVQIIEACRGQAFVLFTSFQMMRSCFFAIKKTLKYPLLLQGDAQRQVLLERFRTTRGAVLFGTDSFWEGVDVVGDALRCVIIVKLPFRVPTEPLIQARTEAIIDAGGDAFMEYTLPHAIVKFKQGFGRLIRNRKDRGCIVCLDGRLIKKGYGKLFLKSLPSVKMFFGEKEAVISQLSSFYMKKRSK